MRLLFSLIIEINKAWQTGAKLSLVEIADLIKNDTSNTVRLLKSLVSKGFIVKKKSDAEKDRKNTYLVGYDAFSVSI